MEPHIQYAKTEDGVSIAFCDTGEGTPVVQAASMNNVELECAFEWYSIMTARRRVILFDGRGGGSSQRDVPELSVEAMALDIGAVADACGLDEFVLHAELWSVPIAIAYAVKHPERVSHLSLLGGFARAEDLYEIPRFKTVFSMLDLGDWELFSDTLCLNVVGWELSAVAQGLGEVERSARTLEQAQAFYGATRHHDVTELLPLVRVPTLVMHPRGAAFPTLTQARTLAAGIPGARLKVLESPTWWSDEMEPQLLDALDEFLGDGGRPEAETLQPEARRIDRKGPRLATILFTDMASSTTLADQFGDAAAQEVRRAHNDIVRAALDANAGSEIKHTGDGIMASFATASAALDSAISIQRGVAAHKQEHPDSPLGVYVGLNAGEPIAEDDDLFGTSINLAARICDHAEAGQILAANVVRELAAGKQFLFSDLGETELRGFEDPIKLWELRWQEK